MRGLPNHSIAHTTTDRVPSPDGRPNRSETEMKSSLKFRAAAMVAAMATSLLLFDLVASIGHPAGEPVPEAAHVAAAAAGTSS
jgi:hypothetical protein